MASFSCSLSKVKIYCSFSDGSVIHVHWQFLDLFIVVPADTSIIIVVKHFEGCLDVVLQVAASPKVTKSGS